MYAVAIIKRAGGFPYEASEIIPLSLIHISLLSRFLQSWKATGLPPVALKAVLTDTNRDWNSLELHEQLVEERDSIRRGLRPKGHDAP